MDLLMLEYAYYCMVG